MLDLFAEPPERDENGHPSSIDVTHPDTGLPSLMEDRCATCVFRPGNLMHLAPGRLKQLVDESLASDTWIVCHSTLPQHPSGNGQQAICRGFYDHHGTASAGIRLAHFFGGPTPISHPSIPTAPEETREEGPGAAR